MGSGSHVQGIPQRPGLASSRNRRAVMERDRERTNDNRFAVYIQPLGGGLHLVRNHCNPTPYPVGSAVANLSFAPGTDVILGSNGGHPGEVIMGGPPPGRGGVGFSVPSVRSVGYTGVPTEPPPPEEPPLTGQYLALYATESSVGAGNHRQLICSVLDETGAFVADCAPSGAPTALSSTIPSPHTEPRRNMGIAELHEGSGGFDGHRFFIRKGTKLECCVFGYSGGWHTTRTLPGTNVDTPIYTEGAHCYWIESTSSQLRLKRTSATTPHWVDTGVVTVSFVAYTSPSPSTVLSLGKVNGVIQALVLMSDSSYRLFDTTAATLTTLAGNYALGADVIHEGSGAAGFGIQGQAGVTSAGYLGITGTSDLEITGRVWPATFPEVTANGPRDLFMTLSADQTEAMYHNQVSGAVVHDFTGGYTFGVSPRRTFTPAVHPVPTLGGIPASVAGSAPFLVALVETLPPPVGLP